MAVLVIFIAFTSTLTITFFLTKEIRASWIKTTLIYGVLVCTLTEGLSISKSINFISIFSFWVLVLLVNIALIVYLYLHKLKRLPAREFYQPTYRHLLHYIKHPLVIIIGLGLFFTLLTALIAPPNNWDSMTYHMPRVMHWLQNQSVEHYPTNNLRQISFPPAASYLVMHLQILAGGDQFANLVQWLAYLGCILASSLIVEIVIGKEYVLTGALVTASIPMAIMQATTTQNDLVVSYWLICSLYFILRNITYNLADICWLGMCFSLAVFTKPTAYIFGLPIGCIWLVRYLTDKQRSWQFKVVNLLVLVVIVVSLSIPYWLRNYQLFGSAIGIDFGTRNEIVNLSTVISNFTRLLAINLPIPNIWSGLNWLHSNILQVDINDPRTTHVDITKYQTARSALQFIAPHEDFVGSPIHLFLLGLGLYLAVKNFCSKKKNNLIFNQSIFLVGVSNLMSLVLFCLLLKFQPWSNRLLLPFWILSSPIIVYILAIYSSKFFGKLIVVLLSFTAIAYALTPLRHPLIALPITTTESSPSILTLARTDIYFSGSQKELKEPYTNAVKLVENTRCHKIGLALEGDDWEYPLWVLLNERGQYLVSHVNVNNVSQALNSSINPEDICAIIATTPRYENTNPSWEKHQISQKPYVAVYLLGGL